MSPVEAVAQIRALCDGWSGDVDLADRVRAVLDAVSVDATPPQGIDRDALKRELKFWVTPNFIDRAAGRILALVRPVEGVVLSPEEARRVVGWLDMSNLVPEDDDLALVNRLEASS